MQFVRRDLTTGKTIASRDEDKEMEAANIDLKLRATAEAVQGLSYADKHTWIRQRKEEANDLYRAKRFDEALGQYLEAMVGLDLGTTPAERRATEVGYQLPLLNNMAACEVELGNWGKAIGLSTEAMKIDPKCVKALLRRSRGYGEDGQIGKARKDMAVLIGMDAELTDAERKLVTQQRRRLVPQRKKAQAEDRRRKKTGAAFLVGKGGKGIYGEKDGPLKQDRVDDDDRGTDDEGGSGGEGGGGGGEGGSGSEGGGGGGGGRRRRRRRRRGANLGMCGSVREWCRACCMSYYGGGEGSGREPLKVD